MKSTIQRAVLLLSGALALLHIPDCLAQPVAPATNQVALRVLIITGGHEHEAAFYGLFDGYQDMGWPAVADTACRGSGLRSTLDAVTSRERAGCGSQQATVRCSEARAPLAAGSGRSWW